MTLSISPELSPRECIPNGEILHPETPGRTSSKQGRKNLLLKIFFQNMFLSSVLFIFAAHFGFNS
jgi:hypothetical protein